MAVYNVLRVHIDSEPSCIAAHAAATSLYEMSAHSSTERNSFLGYGSLVLAVDVLHALDVTERGGIFTSAGIPEGHGGVMQLSVAVGLGSDAAWAGMCFFGLQSDRRLEREAHVVFLYPSTSGVI